MWLLKITIFGLMINLRITSAFAYESGKLKREQPFLE
jgi:hypothetical protein